MQICDATDPTQLLDVLRQTSSAVFCLGPKRDRQVDANGYRHTFVDSFRCLTSLLPQLPELRQINYIGSCAVYGDVIASMSKRTAIPTNASIKARELLMPSSSGSFPSNILENN